jgi:hypothetical protein
MYSSSTSSVTLRDRSMAATRGLAHPDPLGQFALGQSCLFPQRRQAGGKPQLIFDLGHAPRRARRAEDLVLPFLQAHFPFRPFFRFFCWLPLALMPGADPVGSLAASRAWCSSNRVPAIGMLRVYQPAQSVLLSPPRSKIAARSMSKVIAEGTFTDYVWAPSAQLPIGGGRTLATLRRISSPSRS